MQEAALSPLATWQNFYVIMGSAAATLTGLMFVAVTLVAGIRQRMSLSSDGIATFSTPNVVHFCAALLVAALLSAPWQELWQADLLLGMLGIAGVGYIIIVVRRARRQTGYQPVLEDWVWHTIFPLVSYTIFAVAAIALLYNPAPVLFAIAAGTILLLFIGIHNAWDNVTYLTIQYAQPQKKSPDE